LANISGQTDRIFMQILRHI